MRDYLFESYGFDRHDTCELMQVKYSTLHGWMQNGLIRHRQRGTGNPLVFTVEDLFRLGVARNLIFCGMSPKDVIPEVENSTPYGAFCRGERQYCLAKKMDGTWTHPRNPNAVTFCIDLMPLAHEVIGGVARLLRSRPERAKEFEDVIATYLGRVREVYPDFERAD